MRTLTFTLLAITFLSSAHAQTRLTLPDAVSRALNSGTEISTARANLQKAQANLRAVKADPTSIITTLTQAQQEADAQAVSLAGTKLSVTQSVIAQYTAAYEAAGRVALNNTQVSLDERNLQIAQAKLASRVATQLDVTKAQTSLNTNRQELADAKAQVPVLEAGLARLIGLPAGTDLLLSAPPTPPSLALNLTTLQTGVEKRLPSLIQASQAVDLAALQVKLANNDYTPVRTLQDAQTAQSNAQRSLDDARKASNTTVRDAYRTVQDAQQRVGIARQTLSNAQTTLLQTQARLKAGTAAAVEVQQAQAQVQQAQLQVQQAQDNLWKALATLSVASGTDVTGLVK